MKDLREVGGGEIMTKIYMKKLKKKKLVSQRKQLGTGEAKAGSDKFKANRACIRRLETKTEKKQNQPNQSQSLYRTKFMSTTTTVMALTVVVSFTFLPWSLTASSRRSGLWFCFVGGHWLSAYAPLSG